MIICDQKMMLQHLELMAVKNKVTIQVFREKDGTTVRPHHKVMPVNMETVAELVELNEMGAAVSVVPQAMDGLGRKNNNVERIRYLVIDLDRETSMDEIKGLAVRPSIIVETSPGKFHLYYPVKCKVADYGRYAEAIALALSADELVCSRSKAFRIAGTVHQKEEPVLTQLHRCEDEEPISVLTLMRKLGATLPASKPVPNVLPPTHDQTSKVPKKNLEAALAVISSEERTVWLHIGMALHSWSPNEGRALWDQWSQKSGKYDQADQDRTWSGFKAAGGKTVKTISYYANLARGGKAGVSLPVEEGDIVAYAAKQHSCCIRIVGEDSYYVFGEHHWRRDTKEATRLMLSTIEDLLDVAEQSGSEFAKKRLKSLANYSAAQRLLKGLHAFPDLDADADDFDKDPELLGVSNGVVELRTGHFRPGRHEDMITITTAVAYDPEAEFPEFKKFLCSVMRTKEYRTYFRQVCGYWLVGHSKEQIAFVMLGKGSNGKGTLTRLTEKVLGSVYCTSLSPTFMKNATRGNPNGPTPALMSLRKARVIWCTESERKRGVDEVFFKQLTGNDTLSGRHNYGDQQFFTTPGKLVITTNVIPDWPHDDNALWRRVKVLPFMNSFTAENGRNNDLDALLAAEGPGILRWMINGACMYLNDGFSEPAEVTDATKEARDRSDSVHLWTRHECKKGPKLSMGAKEAHDAYVAFAKQQGFQPATMRMFKARMERLGFKVSRRSDGIKYLGIKLLTE